MIKQLARIFALFFFLQIITPTALAEQLSLKTFDIESPIINFDQGDNKILDGIKTFTAKVTDNVGVASVILYYKGATDIAFTPKQMTPLNDGSNTYSVDLSLDSLITKNLEVYIKAEDVSGNSVFEGQKFSPLTYIVVGKDSEKVLNIGTEPAEEEGMSTWTMILIGLGVAALAGSSGGSSGSGDSPPSTGGIIITTDIPG